MERTDKPLLLILGPSGTGKTTLAEELAKLGWLHFDLDQWQVDGLARAGLVAQWNEFSRMRNPAALSEELTRRLRDRPNQGAVLSFPSGVVLGTELTERARQCGFSIAILFGDEVDCLNAFIERESGLDRKLDRAHWLANNVRAFRTYGRPEYAPYRVISFRDGKHRSRDELVSDLIQRCST